MVDFGGELVVSGSTMVNSLTVMGTVVVTDGSSLTVTNQFTLEGLMVTDQPPAGETGPIRVSGLLSLNGGTLQVRVLFSIFGVGPTAGAREAHERQGVVPVVSEEDESGVATTLPEGSVTLVVPVATFGSSEGVLTNVSMVVTGYPGSECDMYVGPASASYGSSTLSATTSVSRDESVPGCELPGEGLEPGVIAGIVVAVVVPVVVVFTVLLILFRRRELNKKSAAFKQAIAKRDVAQTQRPL